MARLGPAAVAETLRQNSIRRGLLGGSRLWLGVFVGRMMLRWLARVAKRSEMPVRFSEKLAPGESLLVSHVDPQSSGR